MQSVPSETTTISKTELPEWVDQAGQSNYNRAEQIANTNFPFYQGDRVAGLSPDFQQARSIFDRIGNIDTSFSRINPTNVDPGSDVAAGMLRDTDLSPYLNPYLSEVEDNALNTLDRSRQLALTGNSDAASRAGAFGGSRHGIVDAVTNAETAREAGILSAGIRADGFNTAQSAALGDLNRQLSTDMYNRDTRLGTETSNANRDLAAQQANQQGEFASMDAMFRNLQTSAQGLMGTGALDQAHRQSEIDADRARFDEPRQREIENLNLLLTSLGMSPYGQSSTQNQTHTGGSSGTDFATMGLGALSLLLGLFPSDDDIKTDKEKIGETDAGLGIWSYRYKGKDTKSIGVMASEVEEVEPDAVKEINGIRMVDYGLLGSKGLLEGAF